MIYKLRYADEQTAKVSLQALGVYSIFEGENILGNGVDALIFIGKLIRKETEEVKVGWHVDVISDLAFDFDDALVDVKSPDHSIAMN